MGVQVGIKFGSMCSILETDVHTHMRKFLQVKAFRSMRHDDMMVGAFSHSTAVGKLRQDLPEVPTDARVNFPRYTLDEAAAVCHYYLRYAS